MPVSLPVLDLETLDHCFCALCLCNMDKNWAKLVYKSMVDLGAGMDPSIGGQVIMTS